MKKLLLLMLFTVTIFTLGNEIVEIEKEVTGVDRKSLESHQVIESSSQMTEKRLENINVDLETNRLKTDRETLDVNQSYLNDDLEKELSQGMTSDKDWIRYALSAGLLLLGIAAF